LSVLAVAELVVLVSLHQVVAAEAVVVLILKKQQSQLRQDNPFLMFAEQVE
jgi:hypothetical protein